MEVLSIAAIAALMMGAIGATAAELPTYPTYEVLGFPITSHQLVMWGPADAQE